MILRINTETKFAERMRTQRLQSFGFDERGLQDILFKSLDRLIPDDELILLMQSRFWQEEPDMMAVDKNGNLYIFELKAWESHSSNLLQVLRYGQLFGRSKYSDLDTLFKRSTDASQSLRNAHSATFDCNLEDSQYNRKQIFVVMTNGLDCHTREAIQYWCSSGLDVRPWVYRVYAGNNNELLLEISAFRVGDNPYEDLAEGYYLLNTNRSNCVEDHDDMLLSKKAAAYFDPWKYKIERLGKGDIVFLYQSGVGIVAFGEADGNLKKAQYHSKTEHEDEEYYMKLLRFQKLDTPLTAYEIKNITGINHRFMSTMFGFDADSGKAIRKFIYENCLSTHNN